MAFLACLSDEELLASAQQARREAMAYMRELRRRKRVAARAMRKRLGPVNSPPRLAALRAHYLSDHDLDMIRGFLGEYAAMSGRFPGR